MNKVKLTEEDKKSLKIQTQQDLDLFAESVNKLRKEGGAEPLEFEPIKGKNPHLINPEDIQNYINSKKQNNG